MAQDISLNGKIYTAAQAHELPALTLAYIGDAAYELYVRQFLLDGGHIKNGDLHRACTAFVSAPAQSDCVEAILPHLNDDEMRSYSRGRNAKLPVGKKSNPIVHCRATGLETVLGFLYLTGQRTRLEELLSYILKQV